jgi:hypothetical protein
MAVNTYTLEHAQYTLFYRINDQNVPVQLPFYIVDIDGTQYYETKSYLERNAKGDSLKGSAFNVVYLPRNQPLPVVQAGQKESVPVFSYGGF